MPVKKTPNHLYRWILSSFKLSSGNPGCHISRLPPDVFLDCLFPYFHVEDVIQLRQVDRAFYIITHEPVIWRRFLERLHIPRPELRPTFRYNHESTMYDIELLVTQSCAVDRAWRRGLPELVSHRYMDTQHKVVDLKLLPGGKFLIATVKDRNNYHFFLYLYLIDDKRGHKGCRMLARMKTTYKAFNLQAKYLNYKGVPGIMISFTLRRFANGAAVPQDINDYSHHHDIDMPAPVVYVTRCVHASLESLEPLIRRPEEGWAYRRILDMLPKPLEHVYGLESNEELHSPALFEHESKAGLAIVAGTSRVIVVNLEDRTQTQFTCNDHVDFPLTPHRIASIRPFPGQSEDLLVVRTVATRPGPSDFILFETYRVPSLQGVFALDSTDARVLNKSHLTKIVISDPGLPLRKAAPDHPDIILEEECPPTIWVFAESMQPPGLAFFHLRPQKVADGWSQEQGTMTYRYQYGVGNISRMLMHCCAPHIEHVIPGAERSLIYHVDGEDRTESPTMFKMRRFVPNDYDDTFPPSQPIVPVTKRERKFTLAFTDIVGSETLCHEISQLGGLAAISWDENSGRICIASDREDGIRVLDFFFVSNPKDSLAFIWRGKLTEQQKKRRGVAEGVPMPGGVTPVEPPLIPVDGVDVTPLAT